MHNSVLCHQVAVIGSGAWACAAARMAAQNVLSEATVGKFDPSVKMWVFQEKVEVSLSEDQMQAQPCKLFRDVLSSIFALPLRPKPWLTESILLEVVHQN